ALTSLFRSRVRLEAEILVLRQQINVLRRTSRKRFVFGSFDRLVFVGLYRLVPGIVDALSIVRPETVVRWHRAGFRLFWRWKARVRGGRHGVRAAPGVKLAALARRAAGGEVVVLRWLHKKEEGSPQV